MKWLGHQPDAFKAYLKELDSRICQARPGQFYGTDCDQNVLDKVIRNAKRAGVANAIKVGAVRVEDFRKPDSMASGDAVHLVSNPPYGERMGDGPLEQLYEAIGHLLKREFAGSQATLIVGEDSPHRSIGLKPDISRKLRNGSIPCRLLKLKVFPKRPAHK